MPYPMNDNLTGTDSRVTQPIVPLRESCADVIMIMLVALIVR